MDVLLLRGLQVAWPEMRNTFKCTKEYMECIKVLDVLYIMHQIEGWMTSKKTN